MSMRACARTCVQVVIGAGCAVSAALAGAIEATAQPAGSRAPAAILFNLQEGDTQEQGLTRAEWNYTFLRGNHARRIFNAAQTRIGTRSNHRKTHLVTWRLKYGLTESLQPEAEIVYKAFRQHTHADADEHDRNDDGDFERLLLGLSYQAGRESERLPAVRLRGGILLPRRAETEGIGEETGVDLLVSSSKQVGAARLTASMGFAMTFGNHDHPADPIFEDRTPISKGFGLRALTYGLGLTHPLSEHWQANLELDGKAFDTIELSKRVHENELTITPGLVYTTSRGRWETWLGLGFPIGITSDTDHLGVSVRTGAHF